MTIAYRKPALTTAQQVDLLIGRGLLIPDRAAAVEHLRRANYYRLSAYWYPLRQRDDAGNVLDQFEAGAQWQTVVNLYEFDRQLRLTVMDAVERVEIAVRAQIALQLAQNGGPFGYTSPAMFHPKFPHAEWLSKTREEIERSKEEFVRHYKAKYSGFPRIPVWMLTEAISLGNLSRLYRGLYNDSKKPISTAFGAHHKAFADWLHVLTYVRNVCAHHSRLWNRELAIRPPEMKDPRWAPPHTPRNDRVFFVLLILRHTLSALGNGDDWKAACSAVLAPIAAERRWRAAMGMPDNWIEHPVWRGTP